MPLILSEVEVRELLPMEEALKWVEASLVAQHTGEGINHSRERIFLPKISLHYMAAALQEEKLVGMKVYTGWRAAWRFLVLLFSTESGELLSLMEADHLGRIRTGAASGVATKYLARADASRLGLIGTGRQARTQLEAIALVRPLTAVKVFSRDEKHRRTFCDEMGTRLGLRIEPARSAEEAARFGDVVVTATTAHEAVIEGDWLRPGAHINAIGANVAHHREVDDKTLASAALVVVDSLEQAKQEAGDLILGLSDLRPGWEKVVELHEVIAGQREGRLSESEITLFKSCGIALWDVAAAGYVYQQARARGKGKELEFLQV